MEAPEEKLKPYKEYVPPSERVLAFGISLAIIALVFSALVCAKVLTNRTIQTVHEIEAQLDKTIRKLDAIEDLAERYGYTLDEEKD